MKKNLDGYRKKYLKEGWGDLYREAVRLVSDYRYFRGHIERNRTGSLFSFEIRLGMEGSIHHFFLRMIPSWVMSDFLRDEDSLITLIEIYKILIILFERVDKDDVDDDDIRELIGFDEVVSYYTDLPMDSYIHAFYGCGFACERVRQNILRVLNSDCKRNV